MKNVETKDPSERKLCKFDFTNDLQSGETITATAFTVTLAKGTDAAPSAILDGAPTVSGSVVVQRVVGGANNADYDIRCEATTSLTLVHVVQGRVAVRRKGSF